MNKTILRDIVELFYQSPFKIFNINSVDGETMVKPFGYFISLGITTSLDTLKLIRDYISKSDYGFNARLVEIKSTISEKYGDYLNMLLPTPESDITKYKSELPDGFQVIEETEVKEVLNSIQDLISGGDFRLSPILQKFNEALEKIGDDWDLKAVQVKDGVPSVFHKYINYKRDKDSEYRIGIYVTKA